MSPTAQRIFLAVRDAMQEAGELGGPEGADYVDLMKSVANEANRRAAIAMTHSCAPGDKYAAILRGANELVGIAEILQLVLTIEQVPVPPPAMGNYRTTISVRPAHNSPEYLGKTA